MLYPSLAGAYYAFTDWSGIGAHKWIGLENFKTLFSDDQSFGSLVNTIKLTVFIVVVQNAIGLALALGVHTRIKSRYVLRVDLLRARRPEPGGDRVPVEVHVQPAARRRAQRHARVPRASTSCSRTGSAIRASRCGRSA